MRKVTRERALMIRRPASAPQRRAIAFASILLVACTLSQCVASSAESATPPLTVKPSTAAVGQVIYVSAIGLSAGALYQVQVCGGGYSEGSVDCAADASATSRVDAKGLLAAFLRVAAPPVQCPCVVVATPFTLGASLTTPIAIEGIASTIPRTVPAAPTTGVTVVRSTFSSSTPVPQWFDLSATRSLDLTLHNAGTLAVSGLRVFGDFGDTPALNQALAPLAAGGTRTYVVTVSFPAFLLGKETLEGRVVTDDGQTVDFGTGVTVWPYGLLIVAIIVLQFSLLALRNILRRRQRKRNPLPKPEEPVTAEIPVLDPNLPERVAPVWAVKSFRATPDSPVHNKPVAPTEPAAQP